MTDIKLKDFNELVGLLGADMRRLREEMAILSSNQHLMLDEFRKLAESIGHKIAIGGNEGHEKESQ